MTIPLPRDLDVVEQSLLDGVLRPNDTDATGDDAVGVTHIDALTLATLMEAQVTSRLLDHTARWLRAEHGEGYYTIGSAGHEANALVALATRPTDPALLHYRSGGFYAARSMQARQLGVAVTDPIHDVLRGMLARTTDPIAGGRHKVFGSEPLSIIPQTSTIASHLPRAVGLALSFGLDLPADSRWPRDSVVVCSLGDASLNHSTAQGALNWANLERHAGQDVPILFVCEDNGIGLSVPTPDRWVETTMAGRPSMHYVRVDGSRPGAALGAISRLVDSVRRDGVPGFLHLDTVRFLGHAGTDVESAYRRPDEIAADRRRDPLLATARLGIAAGVTTANEFVEWYLDLRSSIRDSAIEILDEPEHESVSSVMSPLDLAARPVRPPRPEHVTTTATNITTGATRPDEAVSDTGTADLSLARTINRALADVLTDDPSTLIFGEDVGRKGGVYGVTRGLRERFSDGRVIDTLLDEQSILGLALGTSLNGFLPIPEIQYLAYLHNAEDQLRGEAASMGFFSERRYVNPMIVRIASYAYQRGFGGHFHNDNSIAALRDIPGIVIASPSHPSDAAGMLHSCAATARTNGAVCVYLEPIARYHDADLHEPGDQLWSAPYGRDIVPIGAARTWGDGGDLTILTWGNGAYLSRRAQKVLADDHGIGARIVDLRWIAPLPVDDLVREANATGRVLVVDETRRTGGVGEGIVAELIDAGFTGPIDRIAAHDSFVPLGNAANFVLVSDDDIVTRARDMSLGL